MSAFASTQLQTSPLASDHRPEPVAPHSRFLARQPILDSKLRLFGYELFFRAGDTNAFSGDPELATREVIDHWLMLIPEHDRVTAFVNCTRSALVEGFVTLLPPASTVLEILPDILPDPELLDACFALRAKGYRFALDAFLPHTSRAPFLPLADFIKIDFLSADFETRRRIYAMASASQTRFVAQKIETGIQQRIAISEGCTLFQGYFFSQPLLIQSRNVPQNYFICLKLLAELLSGPTHLHKLEKLISADASLCYRVLRLANSAIQAHPAFISTLHEALLMVGEDAIRQVVTVAVAGSLAPRSSALVPMTLARARFCELLAPSISQDPPSLYLLGMLSLLDALLDMPLPRILSALPIGPAMCSALAGDDTPAGLALDLVRAIESCDWLRCEQIQYRLGLPEGAIAALYVESLQWASAMSGDQVLF